MKRIGIIPARMAASRFPGKPLADILGMPMIEHVYKRASLAKFDDGKGFDGLYLATCDQEIADVGAERGWEVVMTSDKHTRCMDRVAEAAGKACPDIDANDLVFCVQGDEPMLHPEMIVASSKPLESDEEALCTVLAMHIIHEEQYRNPDIVKIIHDMAGNVLYTSRAAVPYSKEFTPELEARRIYGIFAFRWHFLKTYTELAESPLEVKEACDSNRIFDHGFRQKIAPFEYVPSFSVDSPADLERVEQHIQDDAYWGKY